MSKPYELMDKEEREAFDAVDLVRERAEQAALPYAWTQDLQVVSVTVPLPKATRAKDLNVVMQRRKLKVGLKGAEPIMEGELFNDIAVDDSTWTIQDNVLSIELEKVSAHIKSHQWWPHVLTNAPTINTQRIQPETSKLSDLDGETRGMVEKMMFDNNQKMQGKPSSDELKKLETIEQFKKAHPDLDFVRASLESADETNAKVG